MYIQNFPAFRRSMTSLGFTVYPDYFRYNGYPGNWYVY